MDPNAQRSLDAAVLVYQAPDAMIYADLNGLIRGWNPAAERIFGHSATAAIGQNLDIIIPEPLRAAHWKGYDRALAAGDTKYRGQSLPTKALKADGSQFYVELSFSIIHGGDGEVIGALAHARDITERFERDRASRRRLRELEGARREEGAAHMDSALVDLYEKQGQSPWLDFIRRDMLEDGGLRRYVEEIGIRGVTANPTIFEKAIKSGDDYDAQIAGLITEGLNPRDLFERLAMTDVRLACDTLRPVFDASRGSDGFVSIEVSPEMAFDAEQTIEEAKRWWREIERPNLFVKIPATDEGLYAIEECLFSGVNINITLIFGIEFYERVIEAYLRALERRVDAGLDVRNTSSVASFFVSRVDTAADKLIEEKIAAAAINAECSKLADLLGTVAIANAKVAYRKFQEAFAGDRFARLRAKGARVQRPLWASTGTKNDNYSDILYVQELIGPDTVNTMPPATIDAFRDHGVVRRTLDEGYEDAVRVLDDLASVGISLKAITDQLQREGVDTFSKSFAQITETTKAKADSMQRASKAR